MTIIGSTTLKSLYLMSELCMEINHSTVTAKTKCLWQHCSLETKMSITTESLPMCFMACGWKGQSKAKRHNEFERLFRYLKCDIQNLDLIFQNISVFVAYKHIVSETVLSDVLNNFWICVLDVQKSFWICYDTYTLPKLCH